MCTWLTNSVPTEDIDYTDENGSMKRYECKNFKDLLNKDIDFFVTSKSMHFL